MALVAPNRKAQPTNAEKRVPLGTVETRFENLLRDLRLFRELAGPEERAGYDAAMAWVEFHRAAFGANF